MKLPRQSKSMPMPATAQAVVLGPSTGTGTVSAPAASREWLGIAGTFATTLALFAIYLGQGILVARMLGPLGRGEFGHALYLPRDLLLYVGMLGGLEVVNRYASARIASTRSLKIAAIKLGLVSGLITAIVAGGLSVGLLLATGKTYLIPFSLVCCLFLPWEHIHLVVSGVDRGNREYGRYNLNRLLFAIPFPVCVCVAFGLGWQQYFPGPHGELWLVCGLFVVSRFLGMLPTLRGMKLLPGRESGSPKKIRVPRLREPQEPRVGQLLSEGRPYALSMFASELFERLDLLLIVIFATVEISGYYFAAVPAAALLIIAPNALGVFTFNAGADPERCVSRRGAAWLMASTALFQSVSTVIYWWVIPTLIVWVYGESFAGAIPFAIALAPACAIKGYLHAVDGYLKGRGRPLVGVVSRVVSTGVMLLVFAFSWNRWGVISIPWSAVAGQGASMVILSLVAWLDAGSSTAGSPVFEGGDQ